MRPLLLVFALALLASPARAQTAGAACDDARYRAFDFWLGTWDVATADGTHAGRNRIEAAEGGCLVVEHWAGARGSTGRSLNYVDPGTGLWRQLWVSADGTVIDIAGGLDGADMVLTGTIVGVAGSRAPFRGRWTPLADGRVRQLFEQQDGEGVWTTWFDGYYTRVD